MSEVKIKSAPPEDLAHVKMSKEEAALRDSLEPLERKITEDRRLLRWLDAELESHIADKEKYTLLDQIGDRLESLNKLGGGQLLWGDECSDEEATRNFERIQNLVGHYDELLAKKQKKRDDLAKSLHSRKIEVSLVHDDILLQQLLEEEERTDFIIDRQVRILPYRKLDMPWYVQGKDEKRYRKIVRIALAIAVLLGVLIPLISIEPPGKDEVVELPERLAKLLMERRKPTPKPKVESAPSPKKDAAEEKPEPTREKKKAARKKAETSGLMAFKDNFSDLIDNTADAKMGAQARVTNIGRKATKARRSIVVSQVATTSGGIASSALSRDVGTAGEDLAGIEFSRIESSIGSDFKSLDQPMAAGVTAGRSDEEIQIIFDRYKAALYRVYNRELRANPTLRGRMVLRITIEEDGRVSRCSIESSDLESPSLEGKIVARVKSFNFGVKEGAGALTILYPIDFLPAS